MLDLSAFGIGTDQSGDYSGDPNAAQAAGMPSNPGAMLYGDMADQQAMGPFNPPVAQAQGAPWWAAIAAYGVTRAIDNQFPGSPTGTMGNTYPGSVAGTNGRTYTMRPSGSGGGVNSAGMHGLNAVVADLNRRPMLMMGLAVVAYLLFKKG